MSPSIKQDYWKLAQLEILNVISIYQRNNWKVYGTFCKYNLVKNKEIISELIWVKATWMIYQKLLIKCILNIISEMPPKKNQEEGFDDKVLLAPQCSSQARHHWPPSPPSGCAKTSGAPCLPWDVGLGPIHRLVYLVHSWNILDASVCPHLRPGNIHLAQGNHGQRQCGGGGLLPK